MTQTKTIKNEEQSQNGDKNFFGVQKLVMDIGRTFGVPTLLLLLISYWLLWEVTPPMIDMLKQFMVSTIETQAELAKTQANIADSQEKLVRLVEEVSRAANEIVIAEKSTQEFMQRVETIHNDQMSILNEHTTILGTIEKAVTKPTP